MTFIATLIIGMMIGSCLTLVIMGCCFMSKDSDYRERIMLLEYQLKKINEYVETHYSDRQAEALHKIIKDQQKREGHKRIK